MRILMRGLYVFCIIALSASCAQITDEGFVDGSGAVAVSRIVNGGKLYGLKDRGKICTPLQFTKIKPAPMSHGEVHLYIDDNVFYLFDQTGREVVTGAKSGRFKLGFEPVAFKDCRYLEPYEDTYFDYMFGNPGVSRFVYTTTSGQTYLVWQNTHRNFVYGPFEEVCLGCSGVIFRESSNWYAMPILLFNSTGPNRIAVEQSEILFDREGFDEIIEVVLFCDSDMDNINRKGSMWFARNGTEWKAVKTLQFPVTGTKVIPVQVDTKLLEYARSLPFSNICKKDPKEYGPASNQRLGTNAASIVFM